MIPRLPQRHCFIGGDRPIQVVRPVELFLGDLSPEVEVAIEREKEGVQKVPGPKVPGTTELSRPDTRPCISP